MLVEIVVVVGDIVESTLDILEKEEKNGKNLNAIHSL
jgi:hypothetical protein